MVFGVAHLRFILAAYARYCNELRTHLSLAKDSASHRPVQHFGQLAARPFSADFIMIDARDSIGQPMG